MKILYGCKILLFSILILCGWLNLSAQEYEYVPLVREGVEWGYYASNGLRGLEYFYRYRMEGDTTGRVVWCEYPAADSEVVTIPIADIAHGIYIVALTDTQGNRGTCKVVL